MGRGKRRPNHLERNRQHSRNPRERILIVSEGRKTEPLYFNAIRVKHRLPTLNITALGSELGTNPIQVVQYAKQLFESGNPHKRIEPRAFERVFAVFDRDEHDGYFEALGQAEALDNKLKNDEKRPIPFKAIVSVPCFELWFLLHYEEVSTPIGRDEVVRRLKRHIPGYDKGMEAVFDTTYPHLDVAMQRAEVLACRFNARTEPEPFTNVAELVKLLTTLHS
ncbi:MAG: RloB family protein [Proteobacteria bacterium]|nr:RloB family protein [Cystobacterineae bacterium]MCL2314118.1 RloB family protein [Pseudomonadota bacterium]